MMIFLDSEFFLGLSSYFEIKIIGLVLNCKQ